MNMNKIESTDYQNNYSIELPIHDLVSELLSMTLARYSLEIIMESPDFQYEQESGIETTELLKTTIDGEDIAQTKDTLEITLSGHVTNLLKQRENFTLFYSLPQHSSAKALSITFGKKVTQISDSILKSTLYHRLLDSHQQELGKGTGFLTLGREQSERAN